MPITLRLSLRVTALALFLALPSATLLAEPAGLAAGPREDLVVNVAWLNQHIKDPNLVLLHVGEPGEYKEKHLPGARFVDLMDISAPMDHTRR